MNRGKYLLKNMSLFTIGNMASKLLTFLLVPLYTNVLTEGEYGVADVMQTTLLLLVPFLSLNAGEAALRFGIEERDKRDSVFISGLKKVLYSVLLTALGASALGILKGGDYKVFFLFFIPLFAADALYEYMLLYTQGCEKVNVMIGGSVICTGITVTSNIVMLLLLRMGLYGYLISQILAYLISALFMFALMGGIRLFKAGEDLQLAGEMTSYGRGMLMYSTASWANNAIDRYFILFMLGEDQNGLYGAAYKIPAILMVFQRIFAQSFQMSATRSYKEEDSAAFFGELYELYNALMLTGCLLILLFLKPLAAFMFRKGFYEAWIMVPPLLISVIFGALEGYLGSICLAYKDGRSMGIATGTGAAVNICLNYVLISFMGAMGAAYATLISYFIMFVIALILTMKHVRIKALFLRDFGGYALILVSGAFAIYGGTMALPVTAAALVITVLIYRKQVMSIAERIRSAGR